MSIDYSDLDVLLASVSEQAPCGPNLEYDATFLQIEAEARENIGHELGLPLEPNWVEISKLARSVLARSKDLRVAIYLLRALVAEDGLPGLARGLYVLRRLITEYWHCLHPGLEDNDPTWRLNVFAALSDSDGLLKQIRHLRIGGTRQHGWVTVGDVLTVQRTRLQAAEAPDTADLIQRTTVILAGTEGAFLREVVEEVHSRVHELREALSTNLTHHAHGPLAGLFDVVNELLAWSRDVARREASADATTAAIAVSASHGDPIPDDERPRIVSGTHFTVYRPLSVRPAVWSSLLVYLHSGNDGDVKRDSTRRLGPSHRQYDTDEDSAPVVIAPGAEMTVVPTIPGCRFNPRRQTVEWLEDLHVVEFRVRASPDVAGYTTERRLRGHVRIYVGPLLVAEIPTSVRVSDEITSKAPLPTEAAAVRPFARVFVSYSHRDTRIVSLLQRAYALVNIDYLRDVTLLRSGDKWDARLLKEIERADRFQLCWSSAASRSPYVEREWRHALAIQSTKAESFICPFYWETPMPTPPAELAELQFAYFESGSG